MKKFSLRKNYLLSIIFTCALLSSAPQPAFAQYDLGWRWAGSTVRTRNLFPQLNGAMTITLPGTVNWNTGITVTSGPATVTPPYNGDVTFQPRTWGNTSFAALVQPFNASSNLPCIDLLLLGLTGHCPLGCSSKPRVRLGER